MNLDIDTLETSFDLIAPRGDELMDEFYSRLFEAAPGVRPLFPDDMRKQKAMLLGALVLVRNSLRDLDRLVPKLHALGARHVAYGAKPEYYPLVGSVLIDAMAVVAGAAWTPQIEQAWAAAYAVVAGVMIDGAEQAELLAEAA
jgi:methyl-accepting chemotaxis protein